jgi:uncharacterized protein (DUF1800 family)
LGTVRILRRGPAAFANTAGVESWVGNLSPISESDWNYDRAAHLLERAGFGGTPAEIERLAAMSPREAVRELVYYQKVRNVEIPPFQESGIFPSPDFVAPAQEQAARAIRQAAANGGALGVRLERTSGPGFLQPVIDQGYYLRFSNNGEIARVAAWFAQRMLMTHRPLEEKLALFWHGHFATENDKVRDYRKMMAQWDLYRRLGNGNFGELLLAMSKDPAMLIYLDGWLNVKGHANENYGREILELFSLGVGNYTEDDIKGVARSFTGWGLEGNHFIERAALHDDGVKTVLGKTGNFDGQDVVPILLAQPACARFISRKLYRFFVREDLSPAFEEQIAALLRKNRYEIAPTLETIFLSKDFYSPASVATQVKGPVQLVVSTYRKLGLSELPGAPNFAVMTGTLGQQLCVPPNVAGWKGGRTWINPATMLERENFARYVLFPKEIPPPARQRMDFVPDIIGQRAYQQMNEMAKRGDFTSYPDNAEMDSGFNRNRANVETYNIFRGVYNGAIKTFKVLKVDPPTPATIDLAAMLSAEGVRDRDSAAAVDHLTHRFLRVTIEKADHDRLTAFLKERDWTETNLRETLHLVLSMPEYQLA